MKDPLELETGADDRRRIAPSALTRRKFLGWSSVGVLGLGLEACSKPPPEDIVPYVRRPPEVVPGVATFYATMCEREGYAFGLLGESHEGRPTKVEGHPLHPASLGATGIREQAAIGALYDPDRARGVKRNGHTASYQDLAELLGPRGAGPGGGRRGEGLHLLLQPTSSELVAAQLAALRAAYPSLTVHFDSGGWTPPEWGATRDVLGDVFDLRHDLSHADVVVALGSDFMSGSGPEGVGPARQLARRRGATQPSDSMPRLYVVESAVSVTGASADHRLPLPEGELGRFAAELLRAVGGAGKEGPRHQSGHADFVDALARDLTAHRGRCAVLVGRRQPPEVHALGIALNATLECLGKTVLPTPPVLLDAGSRAWDPARLTDALERDAVDTLLVLGGNPAYSGPAGFRQLLMKARERIYLGRYENETAQLATAFVPEAHFLESWGDGRALDGTLTVQQPLIRPLFDGKTASEILALLLGQRGANARRLFYAHFEPRHADLGELLAQGLAPGSALTPAEPKVSSAAVARALGRIPPEPRTALELDVLPDPRLGTGSDGNVPWLLELPEPVSKLVWDNALLVAPALAKREGLTTGDVVRVSRRGDHVEIPVLVQPGQAPGAVCAWLGWGRSGAESNVRGKGVDVSPLRMAESPFLVVGVKLEKTGRRHQLVTTQQEGSQHGRPIALRKSRAEWKAEPDFARPQNEDPDSILPDRLHGSPQWGMAIDLSKCTGCSTCVIACQVENNVPVVGKAQVALGREMHWLRIDRYYEGSEDNPRVDSQPMACQHCEKAPCEYVCPVNATVHSPDGLNEMVYNRCVGTRFCSNNCPYKVRRFNFYNYNQHPPPILELSKNPDVTVRGRGVMEKCTYCVQRIRRAQIDARIARKRLADGDVVTACQQACPTRAIEFGDVSDPRSKVSQAQHNRRAYAVLNEVGTVPRTRYLARIDDENPEVGS